MSALKNDPKLVRLQELKACLEGKGAKRRTPSEADQDRYEIGRTVVALMDNHGLPAIAAARGLGFTSDFVTQCLMEFYAAEVKAGYRRGVKDGIQRWISGRGLRRVS